MDSQLSLSRKRGKVPRSQELVRAVVDRAGGSAISSTHRAAATCICRIDLVITADLVAAVAAILADLLAAGFSGTALWLGGRREERKWRRGTPWSTRLSGSLSRASTARAMTHAKAPHISTN